MVHPVGNTAPKDITPSSVRCKPQGFGQALKAHFIARCQKLRLENDTSKPVRADTTLTGLTDRIPLLSTNAVSPSGPKIHLNGTSQARDSVSMGGEEWCGPSALPELWVLGQGTSHTTGRLPSPQQNGLLCRPLCVPGPGLQGNVSQRSKRKPRGKADVQHQKSGDALLPAGSSHLLQQVTHRQPTGVKILHAQPRSSPVPG